MSIFDSIGRSIKNVFVGSHRGEDFVIENLNKQKEKTEQVKDVDPDDWFDEKSSYSSRHQSTPDSEKSAEAIVTMHEKMYRFATRSGKHTIGGGSEEAQK